MRKTTKGTAAVEEMSTLPRNGRARSVIEASQESLKHEVIQVEDPNLSAFGRIHLTLTGMSPLLMQRFSKKAEILASQSGAPKAKKPPRNQEQEFLDSLHIIGDRPKFARDLPSCKYGIPAVAFKCAAIRGAYMSDVPQTEARTTIFVETDWADLVELHTPEVPELRIDNARLKTGVTNIVVRPCFQNWHVNLRIEFNARAYSARQIISWFVHAGKACGVGEWRPFGRNSTGTFGTFKVTAAESWTPPIGS